MWGEWHDTGNGIFHKHQCKHSVGVVESRGKMTGTHRTTEIPDWYCCTEFNALVIVLIPNTSDHDLDIALTPIILFPAVAS